MVYELERVLRVCNGFLCSMSVTYDGAVLLYTTSRRLRVLSLAFGLTASQTTESALSSTTTLSVSASLSASDSLSVFLVDANVERWWTQPLSCRFGAGRNPRHSALNDVVRRGLSAAGIPSMLEPSGLDRGDGKRPDGITVYPYSRGRCLIWEATCVNTFASSNIIRAAFAAGSVADAAEVRKIAKYADASSSSQLLSRHPAPWGNRRSSFLKIWAADLLCDFRISARVISCSRECLWLFSGGTPSAFCSRTVIR